MKALALVLLFATTASADFQWVTPLHKSAEVVCEPPVEVAPNPSKQKPKLKAVEPELTIRIEEIAVPDVSRFVFPARVRNNSNTTSEGTAISIGNGRLVSAMHLIEGMGRPIVEVKVGEMWLRATYATVRGLDVMNLRIPAKDLPGAQRRDPTYMEQVVVAGMKTGIQDGQYTNSDTVALPKDAKGIDNGDSGGGVFGLDGKLLGTIRAANPGNPRVVYFTETAISLKGVKGGSPAPIISEPFSGGFDSDSESDALIVTIDGKNEDVNAIINKWFRRGRGYWGHNYTNGYRMPINTHLNSEHGIPLAQLFNLSETTKEQLHSALHYRDEGYAPVNTNATYSAPADQPTQQYAAPRYYSNGYSNNCANGNCATGRQRNGFFARLFGGGN